MFPFLQLEAGAATMAKAALTEALEVSIFVTYFSRLSGEKEKKYYYFRRLLARRAKRVLFAAQSNLAVPFMRAIIFVTKLTYTLTRPVSQMHN